MISGKAPRAGCTTGTPAAILLIHFALHVALSRHPNMLVRALAIIDDVSLLGAARDIGPLFLDVRAVFKDTCGVDLKLPKCSHLILPMHTIVDPAQSLISIYEQLPQLRCLPLVTQGTVVVGVLFTKLSARLLLTVLQTSPNSFLFRMGLYICISYVTPVIKN